MPKLSDTQAVLLAAAARADLSVLPAPETLSVKGAALERSLGALLRRGLIADAADDRRGRRSKWAVANGGHRRLDVTPAGLEALGVAPLAGVGSRIMNIASDFDPRSFGQTKLSALVQSTGAFEVKRSGDKHIMIRLKRSKKDGVTR
jgi:OST-HTH/LOTUS domain